MNVVLNLFFVSMYAKKVPEGLRLESRDGCRSMVNMSVCMFSVEKGDVSEKSKWKDNASLVPQVLR